MQTRTKVILVILGMVIAYASGRYFSPEKIKTEIKTVEVEKFVTKVVHEVITVIEHPDGTKETKTVKDTNSTSQSNSTTVVKKDEKTISKDRINVSVLAGGQLPLNSNSVLLGASAQKSILGPVTAGVWVLNNASGGLSIGLNF